MFLSNAYSIVIPLLSVDCGQQVCYFPHNVVSVYVPSAPECGEAGVLLVGELCQLPIVLGSFRFGETIYTVYAGGGLVCGS